MSTWFPPIAALLLAVTFFQLAVLESAAELTDSTDSSVEAEGLIYKPKYYQQPNGETLEKLKSSPSVAFVYFFTLSNKALAYNFLEEYDKSAGYLNAYGITLSVVDCMDTSNDEVLKTACDKADSGKVYAYRKGAFLLSLDTDSMFDVNSIMSNVLQLALLDEVMITQTQKSRQQLEHDSAGQQDVIYSYHTAIGTQEHRAFMEIAFAYQDKFKFVVSTEKSSINGLQDQQKVYEDSTDVAMWVLYCRDSYSAATGCRSVNYRGDFNLLALATFFKQLTWPRLSTDSHHPCQETDYVPCIYIYHSEKTRDKAQEILDSLQFDVHGMAGLIVKQTENPGETDPRLEIRKGGEQKAVFGGKWNLDDIEVFVSSFLFPDSVEDANMETEYDEDDENGPDTIDDMAVYAAFKQRASIGRVPSIPALTDKTFYPTVNGRKLTFVLFYIPFDAVSMLFLGPYEETKAATLVEGQDPSDHPLMRVNCFDWTDICAKENINTYPIMYIYREGQRQKYTHAFDKDVLARTVRLLQAGQPLKLKSEADVEAFTKGQFPPSIGETVNNMVLLNPSQSNSKKEIAAFKEAAKALETQMLFAVVSTSLTTNLVPQGSVVHVRLNDEYQPKETLSDDLSAKSVQQFLLKGRFNLLPELTHLNFPALYAMKQPFGVLFYDATSPMASAQLLTIANTVKTNKAPGIIFCKMNLNDNKVAKAILSNYTQEPVIPSFAIINHQKGHVHVLQGGEVLTEDIVLQWIQDVQDGSLPPTKTLEKGEWKPPSRHYNFLAMIDKDKKKKLKKKKDNEEYEEPEEVMRRREEEEKNDADIRSNLLELQKSRLYSRKKPANSPQKDSPSLHQTTGLDGKKGAEKVTAHTEL